MKWFGAAVKVEQFDDGDRLRFRVTRERLLVALILPMLAGIVLFTYAWTQDAGSLLLAGAVALLGFPIWRWLEVRVAELRVTELDLVAEGNLDRSVGTVWVRWEAITSLQFQSGEGEPDGLYARKSDESKVCLMPEVSEAQASQMMRAIYNRFPYVAMAEAITPARLQESTDQR